MLVVGEGRARELGEHRWGPSRKLLGRGGHAGSLEGDLAAAVALRVTANEWLCTEFWWKWGFLSRVLLGYIPGTRTFPMLVAHPYHPNTREAQATGVRAQASLSYIVWG